MPKTFNFGEDVNFVKELNAADELLVLDDQIKMNSNVGVFKQNPEYALDVVGNIQATDFLTNGATINGSTTSYWSNIYPDIYYTRGNVSVGTTSSNATLEVEGNVFVTDCQMNVVSGNIFMENIYIGKIDPLNYSYSDKTNITITKQATSNYATTTNRVHITNDQITPASNVIGLSGLGQTTEEICIGPVAGGNFYGSDAFDNINIGYYSGGATGGASKSKNLVIGSRDFGAARDVFHNTALAGKTRQAGITSNACVIDTVNNYSSEVVISGRNSFANLVSHNSIFLGNYINNISQTNTYANSILLNASEGIELEPIQGDDRFYLSPENIRQRPGGGGTGEIFYDETSGELMYD